MDRDVASCPPGTAKDRTANDHLLVRTPGGGPLTLLRHRARHAWLARLLAGRLDARLAQGVAPEDSRLLAVRAAQLTSRQQRAQLAHTWAGLVDHASRTGTLVDSRVPIARTAVLVAAPQIADLVAVLRGPGPAVARDVAQVRALLTDGRSALYTGHDLDTQVADLAARLRLARPTTTGVPG